MHEEMLYSFPVTSKVRNANTRAFFSFLDSLTSSDKKKFCEALPLRFFDEKSVSPDADRLIQSFLNSGFTFGEIPRINKRLLREQLQDGLESRFGTPVQWDGDEGVCSFETKVGKAAIRVEVGGRSRQCRCELKFEAFPFPISWLSILGICGETLWDDAIDEESISHSLIMASERLVHAVADHSS